MPLGGIAGMIEGAVDSVTGEPKDRNSRRFKKTMTESQLMGSIADESVSADQFTKLGSGFIVPAQEQYRWGFGAAKFDSNQGYLYFDLRDDEDEEITASVRLQQRDAQEREIISVFEEDARVLTGSKTDRNSQQALPEKRQFPKVGRDSKLAVAVQPDESTTVSQENSEWLLPVTVYPV